jgi:hypothetical protein
MRIQNFISITGFALLLCFAISSVGQDSTEAAKENGKVQAKLEKNKVPKSVTDTYFKDYPKTTNESWYGYRKFGNEPFWYAFDDPYLYSTEFPENYSVEFTKDTLLYKAIYSKSGEKIATHRVMNSDMPQAVLSAINKSEYKDWKLGKDKEEIFKDKESDQMKVYKVFVEKGTQKHTLYFQQDGNLLKDKKVS